MVGYGTIYRFEFDGFCNPFGTKLITKGKVLILKKGYTGGITDIPNGQVSPVEIDYPTSDDDIFYPLKGSTLSFNVLGGAINMDSIISEDETEYFLEYYRDDVLFWSGFVSPELCEEDIFLKYPAIQFKTIDGLGTLKDKNLTLEKYPKGINSMLEILQKALNGIGYGYGLNVLCKTWSTLMSKTSYSTPLEQSYIYTAGLQDKNFQFQSNLDIVVNICNTFNSILYQNYGKWYFIKPKDLAFGVNQASQFSTSGVLNTSSKVTIPTLRHGTDFLIIAEPRRKIRRFYKQSQIVYQRGDSKFINGNFNLWEGTQNEIAYTDTLDLFGSLTETTFSHFLKSFVGDPKTYSLYDSVSNQYFLGLTSTTTTGSITGTKPVSVAWGQGFDFSVYSPTSNARFSLVASIPLISGTISKWYNFDTDTWQDSEYIHSVTDADNFSLNAQFPQWIDENPIKYSEYTIGFNLYANDRVGFTGKQTVYSKVLLNGQGNYLYNKTGTSPVFYTVQSQSNKDVYTLTNPKKSSITPEPLNVYFGGGRDTGDVFTTDVNYSDIFINSGGSYSSAGGKNWFERDEYDPTQPTNGVYDINELNARNILNQYSDYRNIFTGTIIGKNLEYGAIYEFPIQGALAEKKFFPLSMRFNERDCTADVVFLELSSSEIDAQMTVDRYDPFGNLISSQSSESKKKIVMG